MDEEIWVDIFGFEGLYKISNYGRVYSLYTNKILSPGLSQGYHYVVLSKNKQKFNKQVHRLVAENFIHNPANLPIINHKDENKINNFVNNLEWCTYSYNNTYNEIHIKRGNKLKGKTSPNKGMKISEEVKMKISIGMKKYYASK